MSDWEIDMIIDGSFMEKGFFQKINDFLQPCLKDSLNPEYIGIFVRMMITMLTVASVLYVVYFNIINTKNVEIVNSYYTKYGQDYIINNLINPSRLNLDNPVRKYIAFLPYGVIKNLNNSVDTNFTIYNDLVYKVFRIILGFIAGLLLVTILITKIIACVDYSVMAAFIECIVIYGLVVLTCYLMFIFIGQKYNPISVSEIKNKIIDRIITNTRTAYDIRTQPTEQPQYSK